jgi:hypothetical protein
MDLQIEALRLVLNLDELLEPFEDCEYCSDPQRAAKLRKVLNHVSIRYYRRREILKPSAFSLIEMILKKAEVKPTPAKPVEEKFVPPQWTMPKINPKVPFPFTFGG